ncbi:MAG: putative 4-hydroxybenzoate polyprenyltransferase [Gemmatimonadota bacterium]|nr:putative 4-hydroxybenzoate polyprenyltransferase [Gemmatimonadota bacterium]
MLVERIVTYGRMIKFSHSVFALPFAFSGAALAALEFDVSPTQVFWIAVAMVGARSAAMGFNRLVDRDTDAANPRTAARELPSGRISPGAVRGLIAISSAALILAAWKLNPLCFALSPVALCIVFFYSYTKRFTWTTQFFLGLALSVAPIGAWIAITGSLDPEILLLASAVLAWVSGFDIIYACQDLAFDRGHGIYSIPQRFGARGGLVVARVLHAVSFLLMAMVGVRFGLGVVYAIGLAVVGGLIIYEHSLVKPDDFSKLGVAFMNVNAAISTVYFAFTLGDVLWR